MWRPKCHTTGLLVNLWKWKECPKIKQIVMVLTGTAGPVGNSVNTLFSRLAANLTFTAGLPYLP